MNQRSLIEQLDSAIDAMLASRAASAAVPEAENEALLAYGLQRQGIGCTTVNTNMAVTTGSPQLCRLTRAGDR